MKRKNQNIFIRIEEMTPDEYKNGGESLSLNYSFASTPFGDVLIASTPKGICSLMYADDYTEAYNSLRQKFPRASFKQLCDSMQENALRIFTQDCNSLPAIKLHLKGTEFQMKVWEALLEIPQGELTTYGEIASQIGNPKACRAVGSAVGENPVAFLIPCHRVIRASGEIGNYHWGAARKKAMLSREAATPPL